MSERKITRDELVALLQKVEADHGTYENDLGHRDDEWPAWYADRLLELAEAAHLLYKKGSRHGRKGAIESP